MEQNDWTQQLRERLADHKTAVPDGVWDDIERRLEAARRPRRPRRVLLAASWLTAAAAVALLLVGVFLPDAPSPVPVAVQRTAAGKGIAPAGNGHESTANSPSATLVAVAAAGRSVSSVAEKGGAAAEVPVSDVASLHAAVAAEAAAQDGNAAVRNEGTPACKEKTTSLAAPQTQSWERQPVRTTAHRASQWSVEAYAANAMAQSRGVTGTMGMLGTHAHSAESNGSVCMGNLPLLRADYKEVKHHNQPLSLGVSLAYRLSDRLALRSGLVYTRVTSDFIHVLGSDEFADRQTLHYMGVPLALNCKVWGNRSVRTYATLGAQIDFNVKASLDTPDGDATMEKDRPQFSGNAAVGIEYCIVPQVGLYAEPGMRYYFDNRSAVENIFKSRPWAFNLQIGVRINLK